MNENTLEALAQFCAEQRETFNQNLWLNCNKAEKKRVAIAAKYLSITSWFGYAEELARVAWELYPPVTSHSGFELESKALGFDPARFSVAVRYIIALRQKANETMNMPSSLRGIYSAA